jgi:hypothetical protein
MERKDEEAVPVDKEVDDSDEEGIPVLVKWSHARFSKYCVAYARRRNWEYMENEVVQQVQISKLGDCRGGH